jgi:hypothetical protein
MGEQGVTEQPVKKAVLNGQRDQKSQEPEAEKRAVAQAE